MKHTHTNTNMYVYIVLTFFISIFAVVWVLMGLSRYVIHNNRDLPLERTYYEIFNDNNLQLAILILRTEFQCLREKIRRGNFKSINLSEIKIICDKVIAPKAPFIAYYINSELCEIEKLRPNTLVDFVKRYSRTLFLYANSREKNAISVEADLSIYPNTMNLKNILEVLYEKDSRLTRKDASLEENINYFNTQMDVCLEFIRFNGYSIIIR